MRLFLFIFPLLLHFSAFSQTEQERVEQFRRDQEQIRRGETTRQLDSGVYYMDNEEYEKADAKFKYVLDNLSSLPSDFTYYFGKNSYYLGKYQQSIDWLNKYIELKGTLGQYYEDAIIWLKRAEGKFMEQRKVQASSVASILSADYTVDCGPAGKVICPVCRGTRVIITKGVFGNDYKSCPYCDEHGNLTCEEYNLLIKGKLAPR